MSTDKIFLMAENSRNDPISEPEFRHLLETAEGYDMPERLENKFLLICLGRLGLRAPEVTHIKKEWVDWDRGHLKIPSHEPCDCGYCRHVAKREVEHSDDLTMEEAMEEMWHPKTKNSARTVPFSFNDEIRQVFERFFHFHEEWPQSNRNLARIVSKSNLDRDVSPRSLKETAAMWHARKGISAAVLQSIMGWESRQVAVEHIRLAGRKAERELSAIHGENEL